MKKHDMEITLNRSLSEILEAIKDESIDKELESLSDLQSICKELDNLIERRKQTIIDSKVRCKCGHCFKPDPEKQYVLKRVVAKPCYWDSGYGTLPTGFQEFSVTDLYENCPKCQGPVRLKAALFEEPDSRIERPRW